MHSTFIYRGHVYLTDDATGSMRVIDIRDPVPSGAGGALADAALEAGRMLHDIDVKDGLAYLSYWNDGLVILDVGNSVKGGSPEKPELVSQYKYDLNTLYRDVEAVGGPGFIRGTHTAWRAGRYVFLGDEVFSAKPRPTEGGGVVGLSLIPFAPLKLARCPRSLAPTLVTLPSMSLIPFAPFSISSRCDKAKIIE